MRKLYLCVYILGVLLFFLSFFGNIIPIETRDGKEVKVWETGQVRHLHLALDPLIETVNLINAVNVPDKYGAGEKGDGYDWYLSQTINRFFYSIPISVGWFTILLSILFIQQIWKQKSKRGKFYYFLIVGSVFILIAVPLLAVEFYSRATTYESYFHLGAGAYLVVFAYLLIGFGLLCNNLSKNLDKMHKH